MQKVPAAALGIAFLISGRAGAQTLDASLDNGVVKVGVSRAYGGAIVWLSASGGMNLVNNADKGRQIQQSYYAGNNVTAANQCPAWSPWPWNPIMVGDCAGNASPVLNLTSNAAQIYVQTQPRLWDRNANSLAQAYMEQWISFDMSLSNVVIVDSTLTCFRDSNDEWGISGAKDQELPACYFVACLNTIKSYTNSIPWQSGAVVTIPNTFPWTRYTPTEQWSACVSSSSWGVGIYTPISTTSLAGKFGSSTTCNTFDGSTMYIAPLGQYAFGRASVFSYRYYLIVGSLSEIRSAVYTLHAPPAGAINVQGNGLTIANGDNTPSPGDHTDFGGVDTSTGSLTHVFTIQNTGATMLTVSNVTCTGSPDFALTTPPAVSVDAGASTTFSVTFNPSADGWRTATVNISNSDTNANPYVFAVQGVGLTAAAGPIGYWPFEEGSGSTTADASGNGLTGILVNGPAWVAGKVGSWALNFDGSNDRVDLGNPLSLQLVGPMTLAAWARPDTLSDNGRIITKGGASGSRGWSLNVENTGAWAFQVAVNSTTLASLQASGVPLNAWTHVAGVYDPYDAGGPILKLYTNGLMAASTRNNVPAAQFNSGVNVSIGARADGTTRWDGRIDEARIYNRALMDLEIRAPITQYRSRATGNWHVYTTWQTNVVSGFGDASVAGETPTAANDTIQIQNGHTVTVAAGVTVDQVTVDAGGQITVNSGQMLTIADGAGTDLAVNGILSFVGTGKITGAGSVSVNSGGTLVISDANGISSSGASGNLQNSGPRTYSPGANYTYAGTTDQAVGSGLPMTVNNLTVNNGGNMVRLASNIVVSGTITLTAGMLDANGKEVAADKLSGTGTIHNAAEAGVLTVGGGGGSSSFGGVLSGALGLTKIGTGTLTLNASTPSTYGGPTTVSAGTLALEAGCALANTPIISLAAGSCFNVAGITAASYTLTGLDPQQTLAGTSSSGATIVDATGKDFTLAPGALATFKADGGGGTAGKVSVTGDLTLNANAVTVEAANSPLLEGTYRLLECSGTLVNSGVFGTPNITGLGLVGGKVASLRVVTGAFGHVDLEVTPSPPVFLPPVLMGGQLTLDWSGSAQLQSAPEVTGPWTTVTPSPMPPYTVSITSNANLFFRLIAVP